MLISTLVALAALWLFTPPGFYHGCFESTARALRYSLGYGPVPKRVYLPSDGIQLSVSTVRVQLPVIESSPVIQLIAATPANFRAYATRDAIITPTSTIIVAPVQKTAAFDSALAYTPDISTLTGVSAHYIAAAVALFLALFFLGISLCLRIRRTRTRTKVAAGGPRDYTRFDLASDKATYTIVVREKKDLAQSILPLVAGLPWQKRAILEDREMAIEEPEDSANSSDWLAQWTPDSQADIALDETGLCTTADGAAVGSAETVERSHSLDDSQVLAAAPVSSSDDTTHNTPDTTPEMAVERSHIRDEISLLEAAPVSASSSVSDQLDIEPVDIAEAKATTISKLGDLNTADQMVERSHSSERLSLLEAAPIASNSSDSNSRGSPSEDSESSLDTPSEQPSDNAVAVDIYADHVSFLYPGADPRTRIFFGDVPSPADNTSSSSHNTNADDDDDEPFHYPGASEGASAESSPSQVPSAGSGTDTDTSPSVSPAPTPEAPHPETVEALSSDAASVPDDIKPPVISGEPLSSEHPSVNAPVDLSSTEAGLR